MGSGDPRQIDGLGGGVSSLSKVSIVSKPGEGKAANGGWDGMGVSWADDIKDGEGFKEDVGKWEIVWRFGQVGVRTNEIDWSVRRVLFRTPLDSLRLAQRDLKPMQFLRPESKY